MRSPEEDIEVAVAQVNAQQAIIERDEAAAELQELQTERVDDMILDLPSQTTRREQLRRQRESEDAALIADLDRAVEEDEQPVDPDEARRRDMLDQLPSRTGRYASTSDAIVPRRGASPGH